MKLAKGIFLEDHIPFCALESSAPLTCVNGIWPENISIKVALRYKTFSSLLETFFNSA